jgi:hypothetical protein
MVVYPMSDDVLFTLTLSSAVMVAIPPVDLPASLLFEGRSKKTVVFDVIS